MTDPGAPTTREERRAAAAVWRSVPYPVRKEVVAAARHGRVSADPVAAEIGRGWAATMLRPRGLHWWQSHPGSTWLRLTLAVLLVAETVWLVSSERLPLSAAWPLPVLAYVFVLHTLLNLGIRRSLRRVVAAPAAPAGPEFSEERPRSG
jgi:hypothetical protein